MPKAVAVPYVIALILGIIVVAVIGYWFFVVAGGGGGQLSVTQCQGQFIAWCSQWSANGYASTNAGKFFTAYSGCQAYNGQSPFGSAQCSDCVTALHQGTVACP